MSRELLNDLQLHGTWFTSSLRLAGTLSIILSMVHREPSRPTEKHKIPRKDTDLHALRYVYMYSGVTP